MGENPTGAGYAIGTLFDMAAIPEDAQLRFLAELPTILSETRRMLEIHAAFNAAMGGDAELSLGVPEWIDDDLDQLTSTVSTGGEQLASITIKRPSPPEAKG